MTGIFLLVVAAVWLAALVWLSWLVTSRLPKATLRIPVAVAIFTALAPLPLVDEFVGARQFEQLCKENSAIHVDRAEVAGKTVYLAHTPSVEVKGLWVRVTSKPWRFVDVASGKPIVSYNTLTAHGGRLMRALGISEGGAPLTFRGWCEPDGGVNHIKLLNELQVTQVQRSTLNLKEKQ